MRCFAFCKDIGLICYIESNIDLFYLENIFLNPFGFESLIRIRGGAIPLRFNSEVEDCNDGGIISSSFAVKTELDTDSNGSGHAYA